MASAVTDLMPRFPEATKALFSSPISRDWGGAGRGAGEGLEKSRAQVRGDVVSLPLNYLGQTDWQAGHYQPAIISPPAQLISVS